MASSFSTPDPMGMCTRYGGQDKGYINVPCPRTVLEYNATMGGVDQLNQNIKNYAIAFCLKKWYWSLYTWTLNVQLVQAGVCTERHGRTGMPT